ncbi:hypothetical protein BH09CHL1_BH09CHL1_28470 [soil metagenome]
MARTRFIVVVLAIIAAVGLGAAIGSMAGGSKQPIAKWTPPAGTPEVQSTSTPVSGIVIPTVFPTIGSFATPEPETATPQPTFVTLATPAATPGPVSSPRALPPLVTATSEATPTAIASPQASPQVATPVVTVTATATATVTAIVPTTTIGTLTQLTPTGP